MKKKLKVNNQNFFDKNVALEQKPRKQLRPWPYHFGHGNTITNGEITIFNMPGCIRLFRFGTWFLWGLWVWIISIDSNSDPNPKKPISKPKKTNATRHVSIHSIAQIIWAFQKWFYHDQEEYDHYLNCFRGCYSWATFLSKNNQAFN